MAKIFAVFSQFFPHTLGSIAAIFNLLGCISGTKGSTSERPDNRFAFRSTSWPSLERTKSISSLAAFGLRALAATSILTLKASLANRLTHVRKATGSIRFARPPRSSRISASRSAHKLEQPNISRTAAIRKIFFITCVGFYSPFGFQRRFVTSLLKHFRHDGVFILILDLVAA